MVIFARLFGLYSFSHQSCTSSTLPLRKEIYPRKSFTNLYQLIFSCLLINVFCPDLPTHFRTNCFQHFRGATARTSVVRMSVYGYFVLTTAGYILKLEFVRKMTWFYGQVTNFEQLSARKRFSPDKLCYRIHLSGEPTHFPDMLVHISNLALFVECLGR